MNEREFHEKTDQLFLKVEEWVESLNEDIDSAYQNGTLTLSNTPAHQIVLSQQPALYEVWLASKLGAYHFKYIENTWVTKQGQTFTEILSGLLDQPITEMPDFTDQNEE